jgi:hypothetical protein
MVDSFVSLSAEMAECAGLLRPHYPDENDEQLLARAMYWHPKRCKAGRWPSDQEIEEYKAQKAAERAAAERRRLAAEELAAAKAAAGEAA